MVVLELGGVISATLPAAQVELLVWSGPRGGQPEVRPMSRGDDGVWASQVPLSSATWRPGRSPCARYAACVVIISSNGAKVAALRSCHPPQCTVFSLPRLLQLRNGQAAPALLHGNRAKLQCSMPSFICRSPAV